MEHGSVDHVDQVLEHKLDAPALPFALEPEPRDTLPAPPPEWGDDV